MSVADAVDVSIEILGGLVTDVAPADLPHGVSPDCQDVQFSIGSVKTRPGITSQYALAGNPTVNYLKTFMTLNETPRLLSLDSLGVLRKDAAPGGALQIIASGLLGAFCKSTSLFAREYFALHNGINGTDIPRQYDDTNFDRISQAGPGAAPTAVDSAAAGNIPAGVHQISCIFVTRNGYYTKPAPPNQWTAAGGKKASITNIPIGPPNVIARILCFTGAGGPSFYHLGPTGITLAGSNMYIADNVTTALTVDFSDAVLLLGTLDDPLFNQIVLPPVAGVIDYSTRLLSWGEQANLQSFLSLGFDGGFSGNLPLGWTLVNAGGFSAVAQGQPVVFGDAYEIKGDGATAVPGKITQNAAVNYLGNPILQPNTAYTVRARIMVLGATQGTIHVNLQSTIQGFTTAGISQAFNTLTGAYLAYTGNLTAGLAAIPTDLLLQVYVDGTPNNGGIFLIDEIEIYPTNQQFNNSNVRASKGQLNIQGQESYDSQTGLLQYGLNDGTSVRTCFKIRERLYIVKEHSFGATQDDGVNEPSLWPITDVSKKVGTPSVNGVGIGEDWAVIAHRTGLYIFHGGEPEKISQEIQPLWDTINWQYGYTISVSVDTRKRRILVCAPFGASTKPSKTLVLDYHDVGGAEQIASSPPIHLTYTGRKAAFDKARKWSPWTIAANSIAQIEQANGQTLIYFGSNDGTGNINQLDDTGLVFTDNGAQIPSYYTTAFFVEQPQEQALQLRTHRKLFQYMTQFIQGSGTLGLTVYLASLSNAVALNPQTLTNPAVKDLEVGLNQLIERMAVKVSAGGVAGNWFDLQKTTLAVKQDPWAPVRGVN